MYTFYFEASTIEELEDAILGHAARIEQRRPWKDGATRAEESRREQHEKPQANGTSTPQATGTYGQRHPLPHCLACRVEGVMKEGTNKAGQPYRIVVCPKCGKRLETPPSWVGGREP